MKTNKVKTNKAKAKQEILYKSKTTCIVLAIFFGPLAWTYTYKYDAWKLWLNLILIFISFGIWGLVAWIWAIIDTSTKNKVLLETYYD